MPGEARVYVGQAVQRLSLLVSAGRLDPAALAPRVDRVHAALEPAFAQESGAFLCRERFAGCDALLQEAEPHVHHAVSAAAYGAGDLDRVDGRRQFDTAQWVRASSDAVLGRRHVDDGQGLARQGFPVVPDDVDVRKPVQP